MCVRSLLTFHKNMFFFALRCEKTKISYSCVCIFFEEIQELVDATAAEINKKRQKRMNTRAQVIKEFVDTENKFFGNNSYLYTFLAMLGQKVKEIKQYRFLIYLQISTQQKKRKHFLLIFDVTIFDIQNETFFLFLNRKKVKELLARFLGLPPQLIDM